MSALQLRALFGEIHLALHAQPCKVCAMSALKGAATFFRNASNAADFKQDEWLALALFVAEPIHGYLDKIWLAAGLSNDSQTYAHWLMLLDHLDWKRCKVVR